MFAFHTRGLAHAPKYGEVVGGAGRGCVCLGEMYVRVRVRVCRES